SGAFETAAVPTLSLPRVVAAAEAGSTIVAVVDTKPPLVVSHDAGRTWRESGRGLPAGRAVAIAPDDPDVVLYAARNRLYLSPAGPGDAVDAEHLRGGRKPGEIGPQTGDVVLGAERDEHVPQPVVVDLHRQLGASDPDRVEQLGLLRERLDRRDRLLHPAEDNPRPLALEPHGHNTTPGLEPDLVQLERSAEHERRPERRMAGERHLDPRREDADPRVRSVGRRRIDEDRRRVVHLPCERLQRL